MMNEKDFYSTGEVSQLLNISRATVSRKFDAGIFQGKKNPITGERLISRDSLVSFMNQYNISVSEINVESPKNVLLGSHNKHICDLVESVFLSDRSMNLAIVNSGYDALIECSKKMPDLFIIDDELSDIDCKEAVNSLRRQIDSDRLKIMCLLKSHLENDTEEINADSFFQKGKIEPRLLRNSVYSLLDLQREEPAEETEFGHKREWPRIKVNIPATLEFYLALDPDNKKQGETVIDNISLGGALLSHINVENNNIPLGNIRVNLIINVPPLRDVKTECKIIRLQSNGSTNAGVQFVDLPQEYRNRISQLVY